jgi:hypothetical protein
MRFNIRFSTACAAAGLALAGLAAGSAAQQRISAADFASRALPYLPVEEPYEFIKHHSEGVKPKPRDPAAQPGPNELALAANGWSIWILNGAAAPLVTAAEDLRDYLATAMETRVGIDRKDSLTAWERAVNVIAAGTRDQLGGCGSDLRGSKDYEIRTSPGRIVVCGYDERGTAHGLYNLQQRFTLREGPFLPSNLKTTRHSLYKTRMTLSGLGWMTWPDQYLATLPRYGFDAIFASIYRNPNNAPGVGPHWDKMKEHPPGQMRDLIRRAARYGIDVYCPILYRYTGTPDNEQGLRQLVRDIVAEFPEIRGYVLLTEGFYFDTWFGAGGHGKQDLQEWARNWCRGVAVVVEECRRLNPAIEVLPWEYNIDFRPEQVETKRYVISQLPQYSIPLLTFENGKAFELDGERGSLRDYAINQVGPAEVTVAQIAEAKRRGLRGVYSKADTFASWQFGTFPYLPFPYQWFARYQAMEKTQIDGALESWSYGFKPNFVAELRAWYSWTDAPPLEELLRLIARRDFGAGTEQDVLEAWKQFSSAIQVYPDTGPNWGSNNAVASPFFFEKPRPRAMTLQYSWSDQEYWSRQSQLNPYWPYVPRRLILWPDFSNQINAAERYVRPFSLAVFQKYLLLAAERMEKGLEFYRRAALQAAGWRRKEALREVLLAEQLQRMMRSEHALLEFEDLRFRLFGGASGSERPQLLERMTLILKEEITRTTAALEAARRDSRLGYEWEQDYIYTPDTLGLKLELLKVALEDQIPAYRRGLNLR